MFAQKFPVLVSQRDNDARNSARAYCCVKKGTNYICFMTNRNMRICEFMPNITEHYTPMYGVAACEHVET